MKEQPLTNTITRQLGGNSCLSITLAPLVIIVV